MRYGITEVIILMALTAAQASEQRNLQQVERKLIATQHALTTTRLPDIPQAITAEIYQYYPGSEIPKAWTMQVTKDTRKGQPSEPIFITDCGHIVSSGLKRMRHGSIGIEKQGAAKRIHQLQAK